MWRFIPRALRQYIHNPRPSAGICNVDEDVSEQDVEKLVTVSPVPTVSQAEESGSPCIEQNERVGWAEKVQGNLFTALHGWRWRHQTGRRENAGSENGRGDRTKGENPYCLWKLIKQNGSNRILEAIGAGMAMGGTSTAERRHKLHLLYRMLWATPELTGIKSIKPDTANSPVSLVNAPAGTEELKAEPESDSPETLEAVMEEYQALCTEHTACLESVLGLNAYTKGEMESAMQHLHTACVLGNMSACFNLGLCYETGSGLPKDLEKAKQYYRRAAQGRHASAMYNLALILLDEEEEASCTEGLEFMHSAAKAGLSQSQTYLGVHYLDVKEDAQTAASYFQAAAEQQDSEGQFYLAMCFEEGLGLEQNPCRAVALYSEAARAGHASAIYRLAVCHHTGTGGLPENPPEALELYTKAAKAGSEQAQLMLESIAQLQATRAHKAKERLLPVAVQQPLLHHSSSAPNLRQFHFFNSEDEESKPSVAVSCLLQHRSSHSGLTPHLQCARLGE